MRNILRWAQALTFCPGLGEVSWAELALDYEAYAGRALPAAVDHRLWGARLRL